LGKSKFGGWPVGPKGKTMEGIVAWKKNIWGICYVEFKRGDSGEKKSSNTD